MSKHFVGLYALYENPQEVVIPLYDSEFKPPTGAPKGCIFCGITPSEAATGDVGTEGGDPVTCVGGGGGG